MMAPALSQQTLAESLRVPLSAVLSVTLIWWSGSQPSSHLSMGTRMFLGWRAQEKLGCGRGLAARALLPMGIVSSGPACPLPPPHSPPLSRPGALALVSKRNLR